MRWYLRFLGFAVVCAVVLFSAPGAAMANKVAHAAAQAVSVRASAYVANSNSGTVSVIDLASTATVATIQVEQGGGVGQVAASPDGRRVYVTFNLAVTVLDTVSNTIAATMPVNDGINALVASPDSSRVYATSPVPGGKLLVIDTATNQITNTVPIGERPTAIAVTPDGKRLYIAHQGLGPNGARPTAATVVDTATNSVITNIPLGDFESSGVAISPDGARAYVSNILTGSSRGHVAVIDTATNTLALTIPTESVPFGLAVTPNNSKVYVTHSFDDRVSVITTATNTVTASIPVGKAPQEGVKVTPDGSKLLVANILSNNVMIINVATDTVESTIAVGEAPHGLAISLVPVPPSPTPVNRYVALGDSYSSGQGNPPFFSESDIPRANECHRSQSAYPELLRNYLRPKQFVSVACSGAIMAHFFKKFGQVGQWTDRPQLDVIAPANKPSLNTSLITLTLGGNDSNFPLVLDTCVDGPGHPSLETQCLSTAEVFTNRGSGLLQTGGKIVVQPSRDPVPGTTWDYCNDQCARTSPSRVVTVPSFSGLLEEIHKRAPNSKIRVLLYPRLFSDHLSTNCIVRNGLLKYSVSLKSAQKLNDLAKLLNATIVDQIEQAKTTGMNVEPVDPNTDTLEPHRLCAIGSSWFNGAVILPREFSFHPNAAGQRYLAELVKSKL